MKKYLIGIDIGGTKVAMVLTDERGRIIESRDFPTRYGRNSKLCVYEIIENIHSLKESRKLAAIGIGTPGPVDPRSGKIPWSPNLPGWEGIPVCRTLTQKFKAPVFIENDANAAALAEKNFGSGRNSSEIIYITISTGIGGGLILNGKLYSGHAFSAGELGHMTIVPDGNRCNCGKRGCLEAHASGTAIRRLAKRLIKKSLEAKQVKEAAERGDRFAKKILQEAGYYLGIGIGNLINLLNPQLIVLGGGVMKGNGRANKIHWKAMIESAKKESWPGPFKHCRIVRTRFLDHVGALGAASLALERMRNSEFGIRN